MSVHKLVKEKCASKEKKSKNSHSKSQSIFLWNTAQKLDIEDSLKALRLEEKKVKKSKNFIITNKRRA